MKAAHARLKMKSSAEWSREAPAGVRALIVAECTPKEHGTPQRRVALDWLREERNKPAPLRKAAAGLKGIAELGGGNEVERAESDGSVNLCLSGRGAMWVIRSIPLGILTCWAGFEDGMERPEQTALPASAAKTDTSRPNATAANPGKPAVASTTAAATSSPSKSTQPEPAGRPAEKANLAQQTPLPTFAPLAALILNRKEALGGNCADAGGKFITDGKVLLLRAACDAASVAEVKKARVGAYGPDYPLPSARAQELFDSITNGARHEAHVAGYILGASAGTSNPDEPLVCVVGPKAQVSIVNGHRLLFAMTVTGADGLMVTPEETVGKVILYKNDEPVAIVVTMTCAELKALFEKMLDLQTARPATTILPVISRKAG